MNNLATGNVTDVVEEDRIDLKKIFAKVIGHWKWFLLSIVSFLILAYLYGKYTAPLYQVTSKILINEGDKGGLGKQAGSLMDLGGIMGGKSSIDNEVEILKTRFLMEQVVRQMKLNVIYSTKSDFIQRELYRAPFEFEVRRGIDTINTTRVDLKIIGAKISVVSGDFKQTVNWNQPFKIKGIGEVIIKPNEIKPILDQDYFVTVTSIDERVAALTNQLIIAVSNKQGSVVDLGLSYSIPKKGEDILNALIRQYVHSNLDDKNSIADSTYLFIKERLNVIASELGDVENKVESFKERNRLADMSEQGKLLVQNTGEFSSELAKAETQVNVLSDLEKYLKDDVNNKRVFPSSLAPTDQVFANLMSQYNTLMIEREKQLLSVTEESPFIQNIDNQIRGLRSDILSNVQSSRNAALSTRNRLRSQLSNAEGQISGVPQIEKNYLKLARNQQIKQELYIFLMQKAEETAISKTSNIAIAKVIDPPKASVIPISPKKNVVYTVAFAFGIVLPLIIIFGVGLLDTAINTKEDILAITKTPILGEISHNSSSDNLIVANQTRSPISEQFRALRTNLSFYLKNENEKVILLTSSMSGEGKSFTAINLGNILALTGKKVLLMELDLRKPGLSVKLGVSNDVGFSNYTINSEIKVVDIVKPLSINKNMYIVSSGPLPPNPAETLMSEHMPKLIKELKDQFDYIIMDAPPIGIITDAQLLSVYADVTLYLVRQKVTQKSQLTIAEDLYKNRKMKNMGIVVNDIVTKIYGYGYGYGSYGEEVRGTFINRLFKKFFKN